MKGFLGKKQREKLENQGESTGIEARESIKPCELKLVIAVNLFKSMFTEISENVYVIEKI